MHGLVFETSISQLAGSTRMPAGTDLTDRERACHARTSPLWAGPMLCRLAYLNDLVDRQDE